MSHTGGQKKRGESVGLVAATYLEPMKALGVDAPPAGVWHCEIKYDGYRAVALLNDTHAELWSRRHKNLSADYPRVIAALEKLKCRSAVFDGEIAALDEKGRSRFQLLQRRERSESPPRLVYYLFDLLFLDGKSWLAESFEERRAALVKLLGKPPTPLQVSQVFNTEPGTFMEQVRKQGLEGLIAKRPGSPYEPGRRSGAWLKCKVRNEQEFVIGGFSPPQNSRLGFGAILVGYYQRGKLRYAGKVGSGFSQSGLRSLHAAFVRRRIAICPFTNLPVTRKPRFGSGMTSPEMKKISWVTPNLVAQVKFAEWTHDGLLRQPVFLGLREDKSARDVHRE